MFRILEGHKVVCVVWPQFKGQLLEQFLTSGIFQPFVLCSLLTQSWALENFQAINLDLRDNGCLTCRLYRLPKIFHRLRLLKSAFWGLEPQFTERQLYSTSSQEFSEQFFVLYFHPLEFSEQTFVLYFLLRIFQTTSLRSLKACSTL